MKTLAERIIVLSPLYRRGVVALCSLVFVALVGFWGCVRSLDWGWDPFGGFSRNAADLSDESESLEERRLLMLACTDAKERLAQDLASGRLTLLEAASRVHEIDGQNPGYNYVALCTIIPACCDEERHCREVILLLRAWLPEDEETEAIVGKYEDELMQYLADGTLVLPDEEAV